MHYRVKYILRLLFALSIIIPITQFTLVSDISARTPDTQVISTESYRGSNEPAIAIDSHNNVHVVWEDSTDYNGAGTDLDIFYKKWDESTSSWTTTEIISTESTSSSTASAIAIDSKNNLHVVWNDMTDYIGAGTDLDIFYKKWDESTSSWTTAEIISTESDSITVEPAVAIDRQDNVHVVWGVKIDFPIFESYYDIFYKKWDEFTSTWTTPEIISTEGNASSAKPAIAIDSKDNVHVIWGDSVLQEWTDPISLESDIGIFYMKWNASTSTWSTIEVISTENDRIPVEVAIAIDSQDNVHVVWEDRVLQDETDSPLHEPAIIDIFYKKWTESTSSWTTAEIISKESNSESSNPTIALDNQNNVYVAWSDLTDYNSAGSDQDIFFKKWDESTLSWNAADVISTESGDYSGYIAIAIDLKDNVHMVWEDSTNYIGVGTDFDIFYKCLIDLPVASIDRFIDLIQENLRTSIILIPILVILILFILRKKMRKKVELNEITSDLYPET